MCCHELTGELGSNWSEEKAVMSSSDTADEVANINPVTKRQFSVLRILKELNDDYFLPWFK